MSQVLTRRRWMLKAHGRHIVIVKGTHEKFEHPLMKALIWALYLPQYPYATIEVRIGDRYKPDVIAFPEEIRGPYDKPVFWGEAGQVGTEKIESIARRYPQTHFVIAKWNKPLVWTLESVKEALNGLKRDAPFDVISFPEHSANFIDDDGQIHIGFDDVTWERVGE